MAFTDLRGWADFLSVSLSRGSYPKTGYTPRKGTRSPYGQAGDLDTASVRVRGRAAISGFRNADKLLVEVPKQLGQGRIEPPVALSPIGEPDNISAGDFNIAFRFGAEQSENYALAMTT